MIWSLVHEMRISLIFPFVVLLLLRINWKYSLSLGLLLSLISFGLIKTFSTEFNTAVSTNYFITLHYLSMFILGTLIVKHREFIMLSARIMRRSVITTILLVGFMCFNNPKIPYMFIGKLYNEMDYLLYLIIKDWIIALGATILIIFALNLRSFSMILLMIPIRFLGKISYSFYLVHPLVLLILVFSLYGLLPVPIILIMSFILSIVLANLCYKYIEVPSINLGRKLTTLKIVNNKVKNKQVV